MIKDFPHRRENPHRLHNLEATVTVEDMGRETPQVYVALDNHQGDHQLTIVEVEVKISMQSIYVLIDLGSTHSYVSPKLVECSL